MMALFLVVSTSLVFTMGTGMRLLKRLDQEQKNDGLHQNHPLLSSQKIMSGKSRVSKILLRRDKIHMQNQTTETGGPRLDLANHTSFARAYESWPKDRPFPCFIAEKFPEKANAYTMLVTPVQDGAGILFHRPYKTGSTTVAGLVMRLAKRKAHLVQDAPLTPSCRYRANHGTAHTDFLYQKRDKTKSFLFSIIRDPTKRAISQFFHFGVSVYHMEPTDANFQQQMMTKTYGHYYLNNLGLRQVERLDKVRIQESLVKEIIDGYDFIAITERMEESLVVFKMLLGLDLEDILYVRERSQGAFSNGPPQRPCLYVWPSFVTKGMKSFFASNKWKKHTNGDFMLYEVANKSLDLTIDRLGRENVESEVIKFKAALKIAEEICAPKAVPMCKDDGSRANKTTCIIWSEGCSHDCLDEIKIPDAYV